MRKFPQTEQIQYQAARYYLGVHRFAPIGGLLGDMGWCSARVRHNLLALKHWNRMCKLDASRTTRKFLSGIYFTQTKLVLGAVMFARYLKV